jgi:tetratricopeptide (TPR) repeat protein
MSSKSWFNRQFHKNSFIVASSIILVFVALLYLGSFRLESLAGPKTGNDKLTYLQLAQSVRPWSAHLHQKIGQTYLDMNQSDLADRELAHHLQNNQTRSLRVQAKLLEHEYASADKQASKIHAGEIKYTALGLAALASGNTSSAHSYLEQARRYGNSMLTRRLAALLALPNLDRAKALLAPADKEINAYLKPNISTSEANQLLVSAKLLRSLNLPVPAERMALELTKTLPALPGAWIELAQDRKDNRDYKGALEAVKRAESLDPINPNLFLLERDLQTSLGNQPAASAASRHAKQLQNTK